MSKPRRPRTSKDSDIQHVEYIANSYEIDTLFGGLALALARTLRWFNRAGRLVFVHPIDGLVTVAARNLNGYLSAFAEIRFSVLVVNDKKEEVKFKRYGLLSRDHLAPFVGSPRVVARFPTLAHYTRSPLFDKHWNLIGTPGYHAAGGVYYDGPVVTPATGTPLLTNVLSEFCWKTSSDFVNFIGALLTGLTILRWLGKHPLIVFNANQARLGKTLLARLLGLILHGQVYMMTFHADEEEQEKQLATALDTAHAVIVQDNVRLPRGVREIASAVLERCVTDANLCFRRLGTNSTIQRPNDVLFALTMNNATLSPDLSQRAIPINLEYEGTPSQRDFSLRELDEFVIGHRFEILAELIGMIARWIEAGQPMPGHSAQHSVSQEWAATIDAILQFNGYHEFLSNLESSSAAADVDYRDLVDVCEVCHDEPPQTPLGWARCCTARGLLHERLFDSAAGFPKPDHAQATIVGSLFNAHRGRRLECPSGAYRLMGTSKGHSHTSVDYWFELLAEDGDRKANPEGRDAARVH